MTTALVIFVAWTIGALVVARLAMKLGWKPVATVFLVAGAALLATGASQLLPGVIAAWRKLNLSAPPGPYGDTYYIVGHGHFLLSIGLFVLLLAAIVLWIERKAGRRTRWFLGLTAAVYYLSAGTQLAINFGAMPELLANGLYTPHDFARVNLVLAYVSQASFLALGGILVCCILTLRRMLQR